jgi:hypothetical protein
MSESYAEPLERLESTKRTLHNALEVISDDRHLTDEGGGRTGGLAGGGRSGRASVWARVDMHHLPRRGPTWSRPQCLRSAF